MVTSSLFIWFLSKVHSLWEKVFQVSVVLQDASKDYDHDNAGHKWTKSFTAVLNSLHDEIENTAFKSCSCVYTTYSIVRHFKGDLENICLF